MKIEKHLLSRPKAILFDWDNTLVNTFTLLKECLHKTLSHFKMPLWTDEEIRQRGQLSAKDSLPLIFQDRWPEAFKIFTNHYKEHSPALIEPLPGAFSLLEKSKSLNIRMAVVSNKRSSILNQEITHLGWKDFFEVIIGSGDLAEDKPSSLPVNHILNKMNILEKVNVWVVGDMPVDWQCAEGAGCIPIPIGLDMEEARNYPQCVENCQELEKILLKV